MKEYKTLDLMKEKKNNKQGRKISYNKNQYNNFQRMMTTPLETPLDKIYLRHYFILFCFSFFLPSSLVNFVIAVNKKDTNLPLNTLNFILYLYVI